MLSEHGNNGNLDTESKESLITELINKGDITAIDFADEKFKSVNISQVYLSQSSSSL